jgi:hypothetical protein
LSSVKKHLTNLVLERNWQRLICRLSEKKTLGKQAICQVFLFCQVFLGKHPVPERWHSPSIGLPIVRCRSIQTMECMHCEDPTYAVMCSLLGKNNWKRLGHWTITSTGYISCPIPSKKIILCLQIHFVPSAEIMSHFRITNPKFPRNLIKIKGGTIRSLEVTKPRCMKLLKKMVQPV